MSLTYKRVFALILLFPRFSILIHFPHHSGTRFGLYKQNILVPTHIKCWFADSLETSVNYIDTNSSNGTSGSCTPDQFQCDNGFCINSEFRCDNHVDCIDRSDETGCPTGEYMFSFLVTYKFVFMLPFYKCLIYAIPLRHNQSLTIIMHIYWWDSRWHNRRTLHNLVIFETVWKHIWITK